MMHCLQKLRDERGVSSIEMAVALPVLFLFIFGLFQMSLLYEANAGLQHALGEAARYATLYPTPSDDDIKAKIVGSTFGTGTGAQAIVSITNDKFERYKDVSVTYSMPLDFIILKGPKVTMTRSKRVYVSN